MTKLMVQWGHWPATRCIVPWRGRCHFGGVLVIAAVAPFHSFAQDTTIRAAPPWHWVAQPLPSVRVAKSGQTTRNELVFSSDRMAFKPGVYRLTVSFYTNVCLDKDISPIVLNILNHQDNQIVKVVEAVEPSSQASCETGSLQFEFQTSGLGLLEMNLYARWVLSLPHAPIIKYLERSN